MRNYVYPIKAILFVLLMSQTLTLIILCKKGGFREVMLWWW